MKIMHQFFFIIISYACSVACIEIAFCFTKCCAGIFVTSLIHPINDYITVYITYILP